MTYEHTYPMGWDLGHYTIHVFLNTQSGAKCRFCDANFATQISRRKFRDANFVTPISRRQFRDANFATPISRRQFRGAGKFRLSIWQNPKFRPMGFERRTYATCDILSSTRLRCQWRWSILKSIHSKYRLAELNYFKYHDDEEVNYVRVRRSKSLF